MLCYNIIKQGERQTPKNEKRKNKMKKNYRVTVRGWNSHHEYNTSNKDAYRAAQKYGQADGGETVRIWDGDKCNAGVYWTGYRYSKIPANRLI